MVSRSKDHSGEQGKMSRGKTDGQISRRAFVVLGAAGTAAVASVAGCGPTAPSGWDSLSDAEAGTLTVLVDQIVPADEFPSASQAGAVSYIDKQLARHYRRHRETYAAGLARAEALGRERFGKAVAELSAAQQLALVGEIEKKDGEFFDLLRDHTMEGYYGGPRHGGNKDAVSWRMLGLDEPPLHGRAQYDDRKRGAE